MAPILNIFILLYTIYIKGANCNIFSYFSGDSPLRSFVFWPNGTVPFHIEKEHFDKDQVEAILNALHLFTFKTCLKFVPTPDHPGDEHHVMVFHNPTGVKRCTHSTTGHSIEEPHYVTLGYDCLKSPNIDMMIMRALGFPFEHNRASRDLFITVQQENVESNFMELFSKDQSLPHELRSLPYDLDSVMHFDSRDYSKNGHRTIIVKDRRVTQNRIGLTDTDLKKIEIVYGSECLNRDRQEKIELCQFFPGVARRKREIDDYDPSVSLRVNRDITKPAPTRLISDKVLITLKELNIVDEVQHIVDSIYKVSAIALKNARLKYCDTSNDTEIKIVRKSGKLEDILGVVELVTTHAKSMVDHAVSNLTNFCERSLAADDYQRTCVFYVGKKCAKTFYKSTISGTRVPYTQHRPIKLAKTGHPYYVKKNVYRSNNLTDEEESTIPITLDSFTPSQNEVSEGPQNIEETTTDTQTGSQPDNMDTNGKSESLNRKKRAPDTENEPKTATVVTIETSTVFESQSDKIPKLVMEYQTVSEASTTESIVPNPTENPSVQKSSVVSSLQSTTSVASEEKSTSAQPSLSSKADEPNVKQRKKRTVDDENSQNVNTSIKLHLTVDFDNSAKTARVQQEETTITQKISNEIPTEKVILESGVTKDDLETEAEFNVSEPKVTESVLQLEAQKNAIESEKRKEDFKHLVEQEIKILENREPLTQKDLELIARKETAETTSQKPSNIIEKQAIGSFQISIKKLNARRTLNHDDEDDIYVTTESRTPVYKSVAKNKIRKRSVELEANDDAKNTAQTNTAESNTAETNTAQPNTAQTNSVEKNTAETNTAETNTAQTNTAQTNSAQTNTAQPNDTLFMQPITAKIDDDLATLNNHFESQSDAPESNSSKPVESAVKPDGEEPTSLREKRNVVKKHAALDAEEYTYGIEYSTDNNFGALRRKKRETEDAGWLQHVRQFRRLLNYRRRNDNTNGGDAGNTEKLQRRFIMKRSGGQALERDPQASGGGATSKHPDYRRNAKSERAMEIDKYKEGVLKKDTKRKGRDADDEAASDISAKNAEFVNKPPVASHENVALENQPISLEISLEIMKPKTKAKKHEEEMDLRKRASHKKRSKRLRDHSKSSGSKEASKKENDEPAEQEAEGEVVEEYIPPAEEKEKHSETEDKSVKKERGHKSHSKKKKAKSEEDVEKSKEKSEDARTVEKTKDEPSVEAKLEVLEAVEAAEPTSKKKKKKHISVPPTVMLSKKNKEFYNERKWLDGVVPYLVTIVEGYDIHDLRQRLAAVNKILLKKTCVSIEEITEKEAAESYEDYLVLDTSADYVTGRIGGKQTFGSVELFEGGQHRQHTAMMVMAMLGFYFELARHDRDKHVRVHLRHVRPDKLHHFEKMRNDATLPVPYDYGSATHPAWQFWRKLGKKGISTVATFKEMDPDGSKMRRLGQHEKLLSDTDILKINSVYGVQCFKENRRMMADDDVRYVLEIYK